MKNNWHVNRQETKMSKVGQNQSSSGAFAHKSLKHLAQKMGVLKGTAKNYKKILKLQPYKIAVVHSSRSHDLVSRNKYLHSVGIFKN
jgi:hypothetical protein